MVVRAEVRVTGIECASVNAQITQRALPACDRDSAGGVRRTPFQSLLGIVTGSLGSDFDSLPTLSDTLIR
jgi:hypothetical protein